MRDGVSVSSRVSARGLTKVFARHRASRRRGTSAEGPAAFADLMRHTFRRASHRPRMPSRNDGKHLWALDRVSFEVAPGEVLGIIGRNGAGKSTLLKVLARVLHPTAGKATIRGRVVSMLELGIGFAPELTVRENIQIQGRLARIPANQIRRAEESILEFAGLSAFRDLPLQACPSGSPIHLGFAAALGLNADIILADEVLAVGDARFRRMCEERVRNAGASGESVLFVSHDMAAIRRICTRAIWIDRGKIVLAGPTDEVVNAYTAELLAGRLLPPLTHGGPATSCVLLDARLLDAGRAPVGALQLTEPGYIDCLFRLSRPDAAVAVEIELWQAQHLVFAARSDVIRAAETTTLRAGVRVPPHFLNEQRYQARVRLHVLALGEAEPVVAAEERFDFAAMNPHPHQSVWNDWRWARQGIISPRLQWSVEWDDAAASVPGGAA